MHWRSRPRRSGNSGQLKKTIKPSTPKFGFGSSSRFIKCSSVSQRTMAGSFQKVAIASFSCLFVVACSSQNYRYVPSDRQATGIDGKGLDAVYYEPAQAPSGTVRVLSMGVVDVKQGENATPFPALHLRMSVTNQSENAIWKLNSGDQLILLPNESALSPTFVNSDSKSIPTLKIKPAK